MHLLRAFSDRISGAAMAMAALILIYAVCHILLEIVLRSLFATSTHVLDEFIGFAVMAVTFLSLASALRSGAMIRVTLLTDRLPDGAFRVLEVVVSFIGFILVTGMAVMLFRNAEKDWLRGAVSASIAEVPLWIPGAIAFAGAALLALQLLLRAIETAVGPFERERVAEEGL